MADCNGRSLRKVALIERKAMLAESLKANPIRHCAAPTPH
jgi:ATP-dependent DNA ligase